MPIMLLRLIFDSLAAPSVEVKKKQGNNVDPAIGQKYVHRTRGKGT